MTEEGDLESLKVQWREQALQAVSRASAEGEQRGREVAEAEFALQEQVQAESIRQLELKIADAKAAIPTSTSASNGGASTIAQKEVVESIKKAATKRAKSFLSEVFTLVQSGVNDADNAESFLAVVRSVLVGEVESLTGLFHDTVDNTLLAATPNNSGDSGGPRSERFADAAVQTRLSPVTPNPPLTSFVVPGSNGSSSPTSAPSSPFPFPTIMEDDGSGGGNGGGGETSKFSRAALSEHGGRNAPLAVTAALSLSAATTGHVVAPRVCVWPAITEATQERDGLFGGFTAYKVCSHISSPPPPPPPPLAVVAAHPASSSSMPQQSFLKFPAPHDMHSFPMPPDSKVQSRRKFATSAQTAITMNASKRYSEFERLHGELTKSAAASSPVCQVVFLPPLPSKRMVARALSSDLSSDNALVAQRQQQLALWLQYATAHPQLLRQKALAAFCCGSKAAVPLAWLTAINAKDEAEVEAVPPFQNPCVEPHTTSSDPRAAAAAAAPSASSSPPPRLPSSRSPSTANDMTSNQLLVFGPQLAEQELKRTTAEVASLLPCVERALESSRKLRDAFSDGTAAEQAFATTLAVGEMSSSSSSTISFSASSSAFQSSSFSPPSSSSSSSSSPPLTPVGDDDGRKARPPLSSASATPPTPPSLSHSWDFDLERSLLASSAGFGLLASARCRALCAQAFSKHAVEPLRFHCRSCLPAAQQGIERARKEKPRPPPPPPTAAATAAAAASLSSSSSEDRGGGGGGGRGGGGGGSSSEAAATQHMSKVSGAVQNEWKLMGQLRGASLCLGLSDACHEMERACREEAKAWETALETLLQTPLPDMVPFTADLGDVLLSASSGISLGISATSNNTTTAPTAISSSSSSFSSPLPPFAAANADTREAVSTPPEPSLGNTPAAVPGSSSGSGSSGSGSSNNTAAAATALSSPFQHAATALPPKEPSLPVPVPRNGNAPTAAATASTARQEPAPPPPVPPAPRRLQPTATTATTNGGDQPVVVAVAGGGGQEGAGGERGRGRERRSSAGASATAASVSFAASPAEFPAAPSTGRTTRGSSEAPRPVASSSSARGGAAAATAEASISGRTTRGRSAGATKGRGVSTERARRATTPVTTTAAAAARATDMSRAYESRAEAFAAAQAEREEEKRRVAEKRMTEAQAAMAEAEDLRKNRRGVAYQNNGANKNPTRLQRAGGSSSSSSSNNTGSTSSSANSSSASNSASAVASKANQQNQQPQPSAAAVAAAAAAATKTPPSPEHPAAPSSSSLSSSPFEGKLPPVHPSLAPNHSRPTTATTMKAKSTAAAAGAAASTTGASRTRNNSGGSTNKAFPPSANQTFPNATTAANSASAAAASLSAQAPPMAPSPSQEPPSSSLSLPPGWEEVTQGGGKASYFFHHVLRVSRWERPSPQLAAEIEARLAAEAAARTHAEEKRKAAVDAQATAVAQAKEKGEVLKRDAETKVKAWMAASSSSQSASNGKLCSNNRPFSELLADLPAALPFAPKLQLAPGASSAEVKKAYMKAARAIHPDKVVIGQALPGGAGIVDLEAAIRAEVLFTALAAMYEDFKAT